MPGTVADATGHSRQMAEPTAAHSGWDYASEINRPAPGCETATYAVRVKGHGVDLQNRTADTGS